jgi:hypothetical protein
MISLVKPGKSRYVDLYLSSQANKERWEKLAMGAKTPLSKFVVVYKPRGELIKEISALGQGNKELHDELRVNYRVLNDAASCVRF